MVGPTGAASSCWGGDGSSVDASPVVEPSPDTVLDGTAADADLSCSHTVPSPSPSRLRRPTGSATNTRCASSWVPYRAQFGGDTATVSAGLADAITTAWRDTRRRSERFSSSNRVDRLPRRRELGVGTHTHVEGRRGAGHERSHRQAVTA